MPILARTLVFMPILSRSLVLVQNLNLIIKMSFETLEVGTLMPILARTRGISW